MGLCCVNAFARRTQLMAAKPIERFIKRQIQDQGGWPRILERIASGETVADVSRTLLRPDGEPISRAFLSRLLHADAERSQAVLKARDEGADAMVDEGLHLVDSASQERDAIQKARVQADMRLKVAGLVSRERWGESKQAVSVSVNVASLHVEALRHRIVEASRSLTAVELQALRDTPYLGEGSGVEGERIAAQACGTDTLLSDTGQIGTVSVTVEPSNSAA